MICRILFILCMALATPLAAPAAAQGTPGGAPPAVSVAAAYTEAITDETVFVGRGEAIDAVEMMARVTGYLEAVEGSDGASVNAGDTLFRIEPDQYAAILTAREADLSRAQARQQLAEIELDRRRQLVDRGSVPVSELDVARANAGVAEAEVAAARAAVRQAELDLSYTEVTAPFDGRLGRIQTSVGALVGPGTGPLARLVRETPIFVAFSVSERELANLMQRSIEAGLPADRPPPDLDVRLRLPNGTLLDEVGRLAFGDNRIDPATGTMTVRAVFDNEDRLIIDGGFFSVLIESQEPVDRLLVPQAAIQRDQRGEFVLVVGPENLVEQRYIETAGTFQTAAIVQSGLQAGESVIVEGLQRVRPGVPVDPVLAGTEG